MHIYTHTYVSIILDIKLCDHNIYIKILFIYKIKTQKQL